jgi:hypothetical protein
LTPLSAASFIAFFEHTVAAMTLVHTVATMTSDHTAATMTLAHISTMILDTIAAFVIPLVALLSF